MSDSIYIRVKLNRDFFDADTSAFLFRVVKEGCERRIAVTVVSRELIACESDECILSLADSFNFELVTPLIGHDLDEEVAEYRPQAMHTRLLNLQELFAFIFGEGIVKQIEVFLTLDYDIEGLELVDVAPGDFARELERITINNSCSCMGYRFVWGK